MMQTELQYEKTKLFSYSLLLLIPYVYVSIMECQ